MNKKILYMLISFFILITSYAVPVNADSTAVNIYVSDSGGNDYLYDGLSPDHPLKTVAKAKERIMYMKQSDSNVDYVVNIRGGIYQMKDSLTFTSNDSGNAAHPITYKAYNNEQVTLSGSEVLQHSAVTEATETRIPAGVRSNVKQVDLKSLGIYDYGTPAKRGYTGSCMSQYTTPDSAEAELFIDCDAMTEARWPNGGTFATCGMCSGKADDYDSDVTMQCLEGRQSRWVDATGNLRETDGQIEAVTSAGYNADYRTASAKLKKIEENGFMVLENPKDYSMNYSTYARYYVYNIAEELDEANEYYIDRTNGMLYFYPPSDFNENSKIKLSQLNKAILKISGAQYINFENIGFSETRNVGIDIENSSNIKISNAFIGNIGLNGINIKECNNIKISDSEICNIGRSGIFLTNTIDSSFEKSNNTIENCNIHDISRTSATTCVGISIDSIGVNVVGNKIYHIPHTAINFYGLENTIADNEIYDVCYNVADAGAIYSGRVWSTRGNSIVRNFFHDITGCYGKDVGAIYLDDYMSGVDIKDNVFVNCNIAVAVSGGRDNTVAGNFIYDCEKSISCISHWGMNDPKWWDKNGMDSDNLFYRLSQLPYIEKLKQVYPAVAALYTDDKPQYPKNNIITDNTLVNSGNIETDTNVRQYGKFVEKQRRHIILHR